MASDALDMRVRLAAFDWLRDQVEAQGDVLPWRLLAVGFPFEGRHIPLVSMQGIFKPRVLREAPLSIRTSTEGPYDDSFGRDGLLRYAYRGTDREHPDNRGLRRAMDAKIPLVYFHAIAEGKYLAAWPVFVVNDDPEGLRFTVALDDARYVSPGLDQGEARYASADPAHDEARRAYVTATFRQRLHQRAFRDRVLDAYRFACALCRLRHEELLDAAHIVSDTEPEGEPVIPNGLALCKLHHAAFDRYFIAVRPDYVIEVRRSILDEEDGPMLLHGLKGLHGVRIAVPRRREQWPDPHRLERRWERFKVAG